MTNRQINSRLAKITQAMEDLAMEISGEITEIEDKQYAIEEKASERDSGEMTDKEQERFDALEERKEALQNIIDTYLETDIEDNYLEE